MPHRRRDVGDAGQRRAQVPLDIHRERLERRHVETRGTAGRRSGAGSNISRLSDHRNAVSVLPLPVGARISVDSPRAMGGQPRFCGAVGRLKRRETTRATAG